MKCPLTGSRRVSCFCWEHQTRSCGRTSTVHARGRHRQQGVYAVNAPSGIKQKQFHDSRAWRRAEQQRRRDAVPHLPVLLSQALPMWCLSKSAVAPVCLCVCVCVSVPALKRRCQPPNAYIGSVCRPGRRGKATTWLFRTVPHHNLEAVRLSLIPAREAI